MRDSFVFYRSFYEALNKLNNRDRLIVYDAIASYALQEVEPKLTGIPYAIFTLIKPQLDANNKRYQNGKKGGRPKETEAKPKVNHRLSKSDEKDKPNDNQEETETEPNVNVNVNVNDNVNDNVNVNAPAKEKRKRFVPPTLDEVKAYCQERENHVDAKKFWDYFDASGWVDSGGKPVKNWKQKVITWEGTAIAPRKTNAPAVTAHTAPTSGDLERMRKTLANIGGDDG